MLRPATGESATPRMPFFPAVEAADGGGPPGRGGSSCCSAGAAAGAGADPSGSGGSNGDDGFVFATWVLGSGAQGSSGLGAAAALSGATAGFAVDGAGFAAGSAGFAPGATGFASPSAPIGGAGGSGWPASFAGGVLSVPLDAREPRVGRGSGKRMLKGCGASVAAAGAVVCALSCPSSARMRCSMHCTFLSSSSFDGAAGTAGALGAAGLAGSPKARAPPTPDIAAVVSSTANGRNG